MSKEFSQTTDSYLARNLAKLKAELKNNQITIVVASKYAGQEEIEELIELGITEFGESKIKDAIEKQEKLKKYSSNIHWHFIGHLQTNKVKKAVGNFTLIHSVDSLRLAQTISEEALKQQVIQRVLLQVKLLNDPNKSGFVPDELEQYLPNLMSYAGIKIEGLMSMSPLSKDPEIWQECFSKAYTLAVNLRKKYKIELKELSMGMSDDWRLAVKCGATIIRPGRIIFEKFENSLA